MRRAEQLRSKIEEIVLRYLEKNLPRITVSIGVAVFPDAGDNPQAVLKAADEALYRAKEKGRNRVELSGAAAMDSDAPELHSAAMHRALAPASTCRAMNRTNRLRPSSMPVSHSTVWAKPFLGTLNQEFATAKPREEPS